ncbi:unnamed protein product [Periconia digitata]|uniref:Uncharacterized protein n=1 Tax=Periconia digitata TaxID=1303443 RepID=A0A9W4URC2_9PLEO|nr:unnamed protein product [Periconia digitata]
MGCLVRNQTPTSSRQRQHPACDWINGNHGMDHWDLYTRGISQPVEDSIVCRTNNEESQPQTLTAVNIEHVCYLRNSSVPHHDMTIHPSAVCALHPPWHLRSLLICPTGGAFALLCFFCPCRCKQDVVAGSSPFLLLSPFPSSTSHHCVGFMMNYKTPISPSAHDAPAPAHSHSMSLGTGHNPALRRIHIS